MTRSASARSRGSAVRSLARHARPLTLVAALLAAACGDSRSQSPPASMGGAENASPGAAVGAETGPGTPASTDEFEVTIAGGPLAGTHRERGDLQCFAQEGGIWGAGMDIAQRRGLSLINAMLMGVPAGGGRTENLALQLTFGQLDEEGDYGGVIWLAGAADGGDGIGTAERQGRGAVLRFEGTTHEGWKVSAVARCATLQ
jgi:hypothetical protein